MLVHRVGRGVAGKSKLGIYRDFPGVGRLIYAYQIKELDVQKGKDGQTEEDNALFIIESGTCHVFSLQVQQVRPESGCRPIFSMYPCPVFPVLPLLISPLKSKSIPRLYGTYSCP